MGEPVRDPGALDFHIAGSWANHSVSPFAWAPQLKTRGQNLKKPLGFN